MIRRIIEIDEEKCNGCSLCAEACHEGAIAMVEGKAKLMRDDYCDGLGDCLPVCPTDAIYFVEREAAEFDPEAVSAHMQARQAVKAKQADNAVPAKPEPALPCGCPGSRSSSIKRNTMPAESTVTANESMLSQWPVQIKLVPVNAPYLNGANLLVAADCSAFAYADFHSKFIRNRITLIGCPKLDEGDYADKLTAIIKNNDIKSLTVVRMEVPCCGGIESAAKRALIASGKFIPWQVVTISVDGKIIE